MRKLIQLMIPLIAVSLTIPTGCKKDTPEQTSITNSSSDNSSADKGASATRYNSQVANVWMKLQIKIMATTAGIPNVAFTRPYAYSAIALYESVVNGIPSHQSLAGQLNGLTVMPKTDASKKYYWPGSANAALASIIKKMFPTTSTANQYSIDSLEADFNSKFSSDADAKTLNRSASYGQAIAQAVYDWSLTDGAINAGNPYTAPVGPGLWVPTPPAFAPASTPYWGDLRLMVPGSGSNAQPPAPPAYSQAVNSDFYKMAKQVYDVSLALTTAQTDQAMFWRDLPGVSTPGHYLSILEQVLEAENATLAKAAISYALCGITVYDAAIATWQTKYSFNLVRPITYIRNVIGYSAWNSYLTTPAHPEYSSAHASLSAANAVALTSLFGTGYTFTDHTHDYLGIAPRTFTSFKACGEDAANSRLYAGIHYQRSIEIGLHQGRQIAHNILNTLHFRHP